MKSALRAHSTTGRKRRQIERRFKELPIFVPASFYFKDDTNLFFEIYNGRYFLISPNIPRISKSANIGKPKRWLYCLAVKQY